MQKKKKDVKDLSVEHCTWYILTGRMEGEKKKPDRTVSFVLWV